MLRYDDNPLMRDSESKVWVDVIHASSLLTHRSAFSYNQLS